MQYLSKISFSFTTFLAALTFLTSAAQVKPTTAADRMNGLQKRKLLESASLLKDIPFRNIGPAQMNGRVVDIEVNPDDATEFYVAYASGGLWHTVNNGLSFEPMFEKEDAYGIGDIAVRWKKVIEKGLPGKPENFKSSNEIWVGTGEVNSSRSSYSGNGVYQSVDDGKTWLYLGLPESHHIGEIILHPTNSNIAWVAAMGHLYSPNKERGVFKTTDGGKTWQHTLSIDENTGVAEMDINLQNPDELYACAWYRTRRAWDFEPTGATSGIYKSTDGGNNWKLITGAGSGFPVGAKVGRSGVAVFQKNSQIVYAVVDNNNLKPDTATKKIDTSKYVTDDLKNISKENFAKLDDKKLDTFLLKNDFPKKYTAAGLKEMIASGKLKPTDVYSWLIADDGFQNAGIYGCEIYRSDDAGQHWHKTNTKDIGVFSSYGYYFGKIYVSPTNENKVITFGTSIILSTDAGKTFNAVDKRNTHGDWHSCWINPVRDDHWIAGNDGGCNITYDNGNRWFKVTSIPVAQFYNITTDNATPYNVYGGLQDNGTWVGASRTNDRYDYSEENKEPGPEDFEWKPIGDGDGMQVQVDTRDNKTAYNGFQFGYYFRVNTTDTKNAVFIHPMHDLGEAKLRYNWQTPIWLSRHNQDVLYYGANKFFRSLDKAEHLVALSGDLTNGKKAGQVPYGTFTSIHESPLKFGLVYIGTDDGNIQVSKDGGYSWTLVNVSRSLPKIPAGLWVSRVTASQYKEGRVYAALNGYRYDNFAPYLFVSEDYGATWKQLGVDLPAEPLNVIKEDPKFGNIVYVGSDNGLYASFDMGKSFSTMGNLPRVPVHDITVQVRDNELVVGTHGRSIYIAPLDSVHKVYNKMIKDQQMKALLRTFDPKQMQEGEAAIDCPPAKPPKKKKKDGLVSIK